MLANGLPLEDAVREAQEYTWQALAHATQPGRGRQLPDRFFWIRHLDRAAVHVAERDNVFAMFEHGHPVRPSLAADTDDTDVQFLSRLAEAGGILANFRKNKLPFLCAPALHGDSRDSQSHTLDKTSPVRSLHLISLFC